MADKVEKIAGVLGDPSSWEVHEESGELVIVPNPSGVGMIKMHKSEAIRLGLWKEPEPTVKATAPVRNKQRRPMTNK